MMRKRLIIFILFISTIPSCKSNQIKDDKSLEKAHEEAQKGDKKSYEVYKEALEKPMKGQTEEEHDEMKKKIINDLATLPTEESREILKEQAVSEKEETRKAATQALYSQKGTSEKKEDREKINQETLSVIRSNSEKYQSLSDSDIEILKDIHNDESVDILQNEFKKEKDVNDNIISALGNQWSEEKIKKEKEARGEEIEDDGNGRLSKNKTSEIENSFYYYLKGNHSLSSKQNILSEIYRVYYPDSDKIMESIYRSPDFPEDVKIETLKIISRRSDDLKNKILKELKNEYLKAANKTQTSNRIYALDSSNADRIIKDLDNDIDKVKREKELKILAQKNQIALLKEILKKYNVSASTVDRIHRMTIEVSQDSAIPMKAETAIIFSALEALYPHKNFFELKKTALKGMKLNGLFYFIMRSIDRDYEKYDMKILAISSIWKISYNEAEKIYNGYRKERELLSFIIH